MITKSRARHSGFTLIEMTVYLGLFAILTGFGLSTVRGLLDSERRAAARAELNEECGFLTDKISWLLSGLDGEAGGVIEPASGSGPMLVVRKIGETGPISLAQNGSDMILTRGLGPPVVMNTGAVRVDGLVFERLTSFGRPDAISIALTVSNPSVSPPLTRELKISRYIIQ